MWNCITGNNEFNGQGCILADEMGLGKTLSTIALMWTMLKQGPNGIPLISKAVVVAPCSLVANWQREFRKWLGPERLNALLVDGTGDSAADSVKMFVNASKKVCPVLIISYEQFRKHEETINNCSACGLLVCDEGHRLKNSIGNKTIHALSRFSSRKRIILTGTPIQNDLEEFYAMVNFVNPQVLGSLPVFKWVYAGPIEKSRDKTATQDEQQLGEQRSLELARLTSSFILRRTTEVLCQFLPPKTEYSVFCCPSDEQLQCYHKIIQSRDCTQLLESNTSGGQAVLILIGKLKKVCNHPMLVDAHQTNENINIASKHSNNFQGKVK